MYRDTLIGFTLAVSLFSGHATTAASPDFDADRTGLYTGPIKQPDFSSNRRAYTFRTRIREGAVEGVNFAGRVAIITIGCGTSCNLSYGVDLVNGRIYDFPLGGEDYYSLIIQYRPWGRLVAAWWMKDGMDGSCMRQDFVWYP